MKVNFNNAFKNYKGEEILVKKETIEKDGQKKIVEVPQLIKDTVCQCLFTCGENFTQEEKYKAYKLNQSIVNSTKDVEISTEDASLIKKVCCGSLTAGAYGQISDLIEGITK